MAEIKVKAPTQKEMYEAIIAIANGEQTAISMDKIAEFAEKKIEQIARKASSGNSKKNDEQTAFIDLIVDVMTDKGQPVKCGEILKDERIANFAWADGKDTSSQRVSAHLKKMKDSGNIRSFTEKKETFFELV